MTVKRIILTILTVMAVFLVGQDLLASWGQPQFQSRLELYQTNLVLQASEFRSDDPNLASVQKALLSGEPLKNATQQYQEFRRATQKSLERSQTLLQSSTAPEQLQATLPKLERLRTEVDLNLGILQAAQNQLEAAQTTWTTAIQSATPELQPLAETAKVLAGLWSQPPQLLPEAESQLKTNLNSWFRDRALAQLYQVHQRPTDLATLQTQIQQTAQRALRKLTIVAGIPVIACVIGIGIVVFLVAQLALRGETAILAPSSLPVWQTPWTWETVWEVLILGFFFVGQVVLPLSIGFFQSAIDFDLTALGERGKAIYILVNYVLLAVGGLSILYLCIKKFLPLPAGWLTVKLNSNWWLWGLGGYFAALPMVILISLINQKIWQGHGGSNPILPIALQGKDTLALAIFFATAAIAAPVFEEVLFRGFLLPSLTRYFPTWVAIGLSSLIFGIAHLSLSEVLPLTVLGMILGFVYARSGNLLSSIVLHSLWNSGTLLSLFVLGSSSS
jgi:membrane protease YdiL (CAAX protease family)